MSIADRPAAPQESAEDVEDRHHDEQELTALHAAWLKAAKEAGSPFAGRFTSKLNSDCWGVEVDTEYADQPLSRGHHTVRLTIEPKHLTRACAAAILRRLADELEAP